MAHWRSESLLLVSFLRTTTFILPAFQGFLEWPGNPVDHSQLSVGLRSGEQEKEHPGAWLKTL
eukprot:608430-Pelagomonas_calceolata.AAC.1